MTSEWKPPVTKTRYKTIYRPPGWFGLRALPRGNWTLVETGKGGFFACRRTDLPVGDTTFGVFEFERELTAFEMKAFEIEEVKEEGA